VGRGSMAVDRSESGVVQNLDSGLDYGLDYGSRMILRPSNACGGDRQLS